MEKLLEDFRLLIQFYVSMMGYQETIARTLESWEGVRDHAETSKGNLWPKDGVVSIYLSEQIRTQLEVLAYYEKAEKEVIHDEARRIFLSSTSEALFHLFRTVCVNMIVNDFKVTTKVAAQVVEITGWHTINLLLFVGHDHRQIPNNAKLTAEALLVAVRGGLLSIDRKQEVVKAAMKQLKVEFSTELNDQDFANLLRAAEILLSASLGWKSIQ